VARKIARCGHHGAVRCETEADDDEWPEADDDDDDE